MKRHSDKITALYQEYEKEYDKYNSMPKAGSGYFCWKMSLDQFAYTHSLTYKFKQSWLVKKWNVFIYRLGIIRDAFINIDRFDDY